MAEFSHVLEKLEFEKIRQRVLRYAVSEPGKELLRSLPVLTSVLKITEELSRVSEFKKLLEEETGIPLEGIYSVREPVQKASVEGTVLASKELSQILSTLRSARVARQFAVKRQEQYPRVWEIAGALHVDKVLEYNLDQAVDETGSVKANASRELQSIRRAISEKYDQTRKQLESILRNVSQLGFSQDEIITTREGRMVIPVKAEHKNRVHGFVHSASSSGATVFIEPSETLDLNNEIRSLQFQEQREIERILRELTKQVGELRDALISNTRLLAQLDALNSKAKYSIEILGIEPEVNQSGSVNLLQARHPILLQSHGRDATVPLDLEIGSSFRTLVISGPNAGGKSVAMKSVGLLVLMVQTGLHIPASDGSNVRIFKNIFVDIGDEQSIENDLSTFSSHLRNLKAIEEQADADTLVLIDEIGSGTDPAEGGAIAASILEFLTKRGAYTIATTHHSALKVFAHETEGVENGAMEFDQAGLTPTYRFKPGVPGSSYALEMAQRLGFKDDVLNRSRELMGSQQAQLERLITDLESSSAQYQKELDEVKSEKARLQLMIQQYESKIAVQSAELREMKRAAIEEAKGVLENANAVIERSIREIREHSADKHTIHAARDEVKKTIQQIRFQSDELRTASPKQEADILEVGNTVSLSGGSQTGEIAGISPDKKSAVVVFGNVKMKVAMKDLIKSKKNSREVTAPRMADTEAPSEALGDLDLRGMSGDEAIPLVDKFIDTAILAGLHRVDVIHGKGTGALRKKITEFLSTHPAVKSFRLGEWNEGGTGATVVELADN